MLLKLIVPNLKKLICKNGNIKRQQENAIKLAKQDDLKKGRVLSILPESISTDTEEGLISCTLGGVLKKEFTQQKNVLAVGDFVLYEPQSHRIVAICERSSVLSRIDHLRRRKEQILAANVDQVLITVSAQSPPLKAALIDRYLIAAFKGKLTPIIVINKIDLLQKRSPEAAYYKLVLSLYKSLHIPILGVSVVTGQGLLALKKLMKGKASVFSGQSGVGKSSLINTLTGLSLAVGDVRKIQKGVHTTTSSKLLPLPFGGWCVDTPGIRSFGIWELTQEDLDHYFPEILELSAQCHYPNCTHTHEPQCHVLDSLKAGNLSPLRYESYLRLREELT